MKKIKGENTEDKMRNDNGEVTNETKKIIRVFSGLCKCILKHWWNEPFLGKFLLKLQETKFKQTNFCRRNEVIKELFLK